MTTIICPRALVEETLQILQHGGARDEERVVLWLSDASRRSPVTLAEVYEPDQIAEFDNFRLPASSMSALMQHLKATRRRIAAQIHTHPQKAYHSDRDAEWAIIRHVGALSLVLPDFAKTTTVSSFLDLVVAYQYSTDGEWVLRPSSGPDGAVVVAP